ncbi:MAG: DNA alkylation repair protein [Bacteroidetes bacterium]|nr:MAG: DNA alkylation repair protein [Bacteroidota bacterium]
MNYQEIIKKLKSLRNKNNVEGMARFGINPNGTLGISVTTLRKLAKVIGKNHELALAIWESGIHEARILASLIDIPNEVTIKQAESWLKGLDSWDVCDQLMMNLLDKTDFAFKKAKEWSERKEEFEKRAGFALMACLAFHHKKANDNEFVLLFPFIIEASTDERNFVKKSVNWALRQIGKRNLKLNKKAINTCKSILVKYPDSKSACWIAKDALKELTNEKTIERIKQKSRG